MHGTTCCKSLLQYYELIAFQYQGRQYIPLKTTSIVCLHLVSSSEQSTTQVSKRFFTQIVVNGCAKYGNPYFEADFCFTYLLNKRLDRTRQIVWQNFRFDFLLKSKAKRTTRYPAKQSKLTILLNICYLFICWYTMECSKYVIQRFQTGLGAV